MQICVLKSSNGSQKYGVPLTEFHRLKLQIGSPIRVTTPRGTFICKLYPRNDLKDDVAIENTVQVFSQRWNCILKQPLLGETLVTSLSSPKSAGAVTVTIVAKDFKSFQMLKKIKISAFIRNLMSNKVFSPLSCLNVEDFFPEGSVSKILILEVSPHCEAFTVNSKTTIKTDKILTSHWMETQAKIKNVKLGGVTQAYAKLVELAVNPLQHVHVFNRLCVPRGILLHGPSGCGKNAIVQQLCAEFNLSLVTISCSDLSSSDPGGSEEKLNNIFKECVAISTPTVIFLDEVDSICPKRGGQAHTNRLTSCLIGLIDNLEQSRQLIIVAATNRLEDVDSSLRRPGRLDREILLGAPNCEQRQEIIQAVCQELEMDSSLFQQVGEMTPGYVGADLNLLCREALYLSPEGSCSPTLKEWKTAISRVTPSMMRGNTRNAEFRKVTWEQVGGLEEAKMYIRRSVEWPLRHPEAFERLNVPRPKGVLIYGPPGCGKSLLVRAAATSCAASFFSVSAAELFSPFVGDSEKMVSDLFRRARQAVPAILFLDELDAMVGGRSSSNHGRTAQLGVVATLLQEMDGISSSQGVIVVGATNRPDKIDGALLRPGRFDSLVHIPHPDKKARLDVLRSLCLKMPLKDVDLDSLAEQTDLYSGADLESLTKEAALVALEKDMSATHIHQDHFQQALLKVVPSLTRQQVEFYRDYASCKEAS